MKKRMWFMAMVKFKNPDEVVTLEFDYPEDRDIFIDNIMQDKRYVTHKFFMR